MPKQTFAAAKKETLDYLAKLGWEVRPQLDVPRAISPSRNIHLWFKPQSVYLARGERPTLGDAHSLFVDLRDVTPQQLAHLVLSQSSIPPHVDDKDREKARSVTRIQELTLALNNDTAASLPETTQVAMLKERAALVERLRLLGFQADGRPSVLPARQLKNGLSAEAQRGRAFWSTFLAELSRYIATNFEQVVDDWHLSHNRRAALTVWIHDRLYAKDSPILPEHRDALAEIVAARVVRSARFGLWQAFGGAGGSYQAEFERTCHALLVKPYRMLTPSEGPLPPLNAAEIVTELLSTVRDPSLYSVQLWRARVKKLMRGLNGGLRELALEDLVRLARLTREGQYRI